MVNAGTQAGGTRLPQCWMRGTAPHPLLLIVLALGVLALGVPALGVLALGTASASPAGGQTPPASGATGPAAASVTAQASPGDQEAAPYWIENAELQAARQPAGDDPEAVGRGEEFITRGEVFDSADYQYLLLVSPAWEEALVLSLGTGDVAAYPLTAVMGSDGRPSRVDPAAGTRVASFTTHEDGRITFGTTDVDYIVEPAAPLVGEIPLPVLFARQPAYARRAAGYTPDPAMIAKLAGIAQDVEIVAFFGTWCQICKKQFPALISTIEHAGNPHLKLTPIAVSEDGTEPADWIEACGAGYATPTFIVRIHGEEVGRIEEEPRVSVEADLVEILAGAPGH
jgi:hypothetical protein